MSKPKNYEMKSPAEKEYELDASGMGEGRNSMGHYLPSMHSLKLFSGDKHPFC
jgi:hypothetical protein